MKAKYTDRISYLPEQILALRMSESNASNVSQGILIMETRYSPNVTYKIFTCLCEHPIERERKKKKKKTKKKKNYIKKFKFKIIKRI